MDEKPVGLGTVRFVAQCGTDSQQVLSKAKSVLTEVDQVALREWPGDSTWREILPAWFVARCAAEQTREEAETWLKWWRALPPDEQAEVERNKPWSLTAWLHWLKPTENRKWFWWDAAESGGNKIILAVEVKDWPFPWGSLAWLLRAAGATRVDAEE